jgi:glutamate synthase (NADPH/NADH) large chain
MSGGIAYVIDDAGDFEQRVNHQMVEIERVVADDGVPCSKPDNPSRDELLSDSLSNDVWRLKILIARHARLTNSSRAQEILDNFDEYLPRFYKVVPLEFRRALEQSTPVAGSV